MRAFRLILLIEKSGLSASSALEPELGAHFADEIHSPGRHRDAPFAREGFLYDTNK